MLNIVKRTAVGLILFLLLGLIVATVGVKWVLLTMMAAVAGFMCYMIGEIIMELFE